jgi:DNA repair exonuclease SbcCD ATPase subunit
MIRINRVRYKNFLSTGNLFTEIDISSSKTLLIIGLNGAGKSTLLDAVSFGLFGKPYRKINKPQIVNSITKRDAVVEVEFTCGSNSYLVRRGASPAIFEVYGNGVLLNQTDVRDYQQILEKQILKVNHKTFCQLVILGSAAFQPFMQLATGQRREIIEDLLDLQVFTSMNLVLREKLQDNTSNIYETSKAKILLEERIKLLRQHNAAVLQSRDAIIAEKRSLIEDVDTQFDKLENERMSLLKKSLAIDESITDDGISDRISELVGIRHKIEANAARIKKDIKFFETNDVCPTCSQDIGSDFKASSITSRTSKISEIESALDKLEARHETLSATLKKFSELRSESAKLIADAMSLGIKQNELLSRKKIFEADLVELTKPLQADRSDELETIELELIQTSEKLSELESQRDLLSAAALLLKDGGVKAKIIRQYIPVMNKLINKYLNEFELFAEFELDENFNETIRSRHRDVFSYSSFSEGEKARIDLAILFAWRDISRLRNSVNTNLLIMDEVFDGSLDGEGSEYLMRLVSKLSQESNVIVISHKVDMMNEKFESVLKFGKVKNFSSIVDEVA